MLRRLSGLARRPRVAALALVLAILAAYFVPRAVALRGVEYTSTLVFGDMPLHLLNLERLHKVKTQGFTAEETPYFEHLPNELALLNAMRWPPGVYWLGLPLVELFGPLSIWTVQGINLLFQGVMVLGLVLLGLRLHSLRLGLWAALLAVLCPPLVGASWYLTLDFPLAAVTTLSLAMLLRTDGFRRLRASLAFGLVAALSLFVKLTLPLYLLFPACWVLAHGLMHRPRRRAVGGLALALGAFLALSLLLGNFNVVQNLRDLAYHADPNVVDEALPDMVFKAGTASWFLAVGRFVLHSYTWPLTLLLLPGLLMLLRRRGAALPGRSALLLFLGGHYLVFTVIHAKMERYSQPIYPLLCLLTAWWILRWVPRRWRWVGLTWAAATFAAVLVLAHQRPLPWTVGPEGPATASMFYDNRPPTANELAGLRRWAYHPACDLRPVMAAARAMGRQIPPGVVISMAYPATPKDEVLPQVSLTYDVLAAMATQLFPHNIVINAPLVRDYMPAPFTFLLHRPTQDAGSIHPNARVLGRRALSFTCIWPSDMTLTLIRSPERVRRPGHKTLEQLQREQGEEQPPQEEP